MKLILDMVLYCEGCGEYHTFQLFSYSYKNGGEVTYRCLETGVVVTVDMEKVVEK